MYTPLRVFRWPPGWPIWTSLASVSATRNSGFSTVGSPTRARFVPAVMRCPSSSGTCCEADRLLRGRVFVDLHRVVRQGMRASVESYSIKRWSRSKGTDQIRVESRGGA